MLIRFLSLALLLATAPAFAQTQFQMNQEACASYADADKRLNVVYGQVLSQHKDDKLFVKNLKKAQRAWLAFRDAELGAVYPAANKQFEYGSIYPMCNCLEQATLVKQRIDQLSQWLTAEEGDTCRGSR